MIPLKHTATVIKSSSIDDWGIPVPGTSVIYPCRIDYETKKVVDQSGAEVVASATILLKGLVDIDYSDTIRWNDSIHTYERKPISISPLSDFTGKVIFTRVVV